MPALTYHKLAEVAEQWPIVGRSDLYYGGTTYDNHQGLGVQLSPAAERGRACRLWLQVEPAPAPQTGRRCWLCRSPGCTTWARPLTALRAADDRASTRPMVIAAPGRRPPRLGLADGQPARREPERGDGQRAQVVVDETVPDGVALVPRSTGLPIDRPAPAQVQACASQQAEHRRLRPA